jgi:2-keto-3-deoxy-L-rhamnonate aldolase RhmA
MTNAGALVKQHSLKSKLKDGKQVVGSWITLGHPAIAEIMARAGYDWLTIDLEHTTIDLAEAQELIRTCDLLGVTPLVRLSANDPVQIKRVMDAGAGGIIVPNVQTAEEAQAAVAAVYYPPRGNRGVGLARAQKYGAGFAAYKNWLADEAVVVVQIEHKKAVENLPAILATEGVDALMVGPYDLSGSFGKPGEFNDPEYLQALKRISEVSASSPVVKGVHVVEPDKARFDQAVADGYRMIAYSVDIRMLDIACRSVF